jgi:Domain of unknown function (DUF4136)
MTLSRLNRTVESGKTAQRNPCASEEVFVSSTVYSVRARIPLTLASIALVIALGLTVATASAQDVGYNAMPGTDFSKYKTYKWVKIEGAQYPDQITDAQIRSAIDGQLASKGLTKTEDDAADLYVGYQIAIDKEKQWNAYNMGGVGWGWGAGYGAYGGGTTTATSSTITIGTLGLDVYDRAVKQLVWRGRASKTIDPNAKPEKRQKNLNKAMTKLLKNYPPPVKK